MWFSLRYNKRCIKAFSLILTLLQFKCYLIFKKHVANDKKSKAEFDLYISEHELKMQEKIKDLETQNSSFKISKILFI